MEIGIRINANGRIINRRRMGRASFIDVLSNGEILQLFANSELPRYEELTSLHAGSFISFSGETFLTRTGHPTIGVESFSTLLVPRMHLPQRTESDGVVHNGIVNPETIRRRRYLQTITDSEERNVFIMRSRIISNIRRFFESRGYLEVETPVLQPVYGGAEANPFVTRFEALDSNFYLRIAPEMYLRRMLIGGYERVFEIGRNFRNEGLSGRHNPEFTFMEAYTAFEDYRYSMDLTIELFRSLTSEFGNIGRHGEIEIDMSEIRTVSFRELLNENGVGDAWGRENVESIFEEHVQGRLVNPTIVYDYPASISPLATVSPENPEVAERFELFAGGIEIGNAYSELNDVETHIRNVGTDDEDFIEALSYGMPPSTGIGLGIDRIIMLFTGRSIRDVIFFPAMAPER
jgi:lysyl-tRNA synthetase class 2